MLTDTKRGYMCIMIIGLVGAAFYIQDAGLPDSVSVPRVVELGVSKKALRKIHQRAREHFGERWPSTTTTDMVMEYVKPLTISKHCRLTELPGYLDKNEIGQPTYFISHAWKAPAELLFSRIDDFLGDADDSTRVWVDCFAVNQHGDDEAGRKQNKEDVGAFEDVVVASEGGTMVVVDIRFNPATRGWCIYEWCVACRPIATALNTKDDLSLMVLALIWHI